jgi:hypothetical protein
VLVNALATIVIAHMEKGVDLPALDSELRGGRESAANLTKDSK